MSPVQSAAVKPSAAIFYSGHSLTDNPLPDDVEQIARSLGAPLVWNQQNIAGSTIRKRTRGERADATDWAGYRQGKNRQGQGLDVVAELRQPRTLGEGVRYDTLLITEGHWSARAIGWDDTVRYLRHFHDRLIEGNAEATTWFYEPWISLNDKGDPTEWIRYERAASPVWQCAVGRVNHSLQLEGRRDRIRALPAALALADLIERATRGSGVEGLTQPTVRATVDKLIADDVHLTRTGIYYMALVTYAAVQGRSPAGAWAPGDVSPSLAKTLQTLAWDFVAPRRAQASVLPDLAGCSQTMVGSFCGLYADYMRQTYWAKEHGVLRSHVKRYREAAACKARFAAGQAHNPFFFSAANDRARWFPAP